VSIWPFLSVSFPRDQPVKYFAAAFSIFATEVGFCFGNLMEGTCLAGTLGDFQDMRSMIAIDALTV
jgi:hypothetical protein